MTWEDTRYLKMKEFQALLEHLNDTAKARAMRSRAKL